MILDIASYQTGVIVHVIFCPTDVDPDGGSLVASSGCPPTVLGGGIDSLACIKERIKSI